MSSDDRSKKKKRHKKKRKEKTAKTSEEVEQLEIGTNAPVAEAQLSSVKAEEIPKDPEHHNQYLMRRYVSRLSFKIVQLILDRVSRAFIKFLS